MIKNGGHYFKVIIQTARKVKQVQYGDLDKLSETLDIHYQEPKQLKIVTPAGNAEVSEEVSSEDKLRETKEKFEKWIKAAEQMKDIIGKKLKNRQVQVPVSKDLSVRDAIGRIFNIDSDTVTYDMFKYCLELRSQILEEQRKANYGTSKSVSRNTDGSSTKE